MKLACQLDENGYFVSMVNCQPSPLEPGIYLIPGGSIDVEEPAVPENYRAKWLGDRWTFEIIHGEKDGT